MEQIRRMNRLFVSDSLFLRDQLKIPVSREFPNSFEADNSDFESTSESLLTSVSTESFTYEDEESINDLFCKIDNSIANTRVLVKQVQDQSR